MSLELPSNEILVQQLKWRYAVKQFDPTRKVSAADWQALEETLILTPTSYGLQPVKYIVVTNQATKEQLTPHAFNQTQVRDCSHLVVIAGKTDVAESDIENYLDRVTATREVTRDSQADFAKVLHGFSQKLQTDNKTAEWSARQAYIALGFLLMAAALRGIDSCPMEGFSPAGVNEILNLDQQKLSAVVLCPIGYRAPEDWLGNLAKVRQPRESIIQEIS